MALCKVMIIGNLGADPAERAAENLRKGNRVFVEGRFKTREFEGRDGQKRTSLEITADSLVNLEKRNREEGDGEFAAAGAAPARPAGAPAGGGAPRGGGGGGFDDTSDLDDLPF
jgi:single-strand DNA-binding protein